MNILGAAEIKDRVRSFFKKGHKSNNKLYKVTHDGHAEVWPMTAKHEKRWNECDNSDQHRLSGATSNYNIAEQLVKMNVGDRSGNCGEMAALSGYYALKIHFIKPELIYIGTVYKKGDHAFCLISEDTINSKHLNFSSVAEFTQLQAAKAWLIVDPWLNTVCRADQYLLESGNKLNEWTTDGKRVNWNSGSQGPGWYVPNGEYKTEFGKAPIKLMPF
ncbi:MULTISPECIES: hypothetical protein [Methylomonas]|uniref:Uncharacterized protein n=2 Tax=Methylomonas TaxID=416 RepID=A0A140E690_9GAMM|nr:MULTISPECIES: hypothetical protein [Methylomonas]AMK78914.1 hypothetical protein JT25_020910 [Methylomonas denitrificans]OAI01433.1 hypothetical protein A1342_09615 [Methylomonas methanica]TCV76844.1 hypothetical protein EDE11_1321 [Methylomonas methanica]